MKHIIYYVIAIMSILMLISCNSASVNEAKDIFSNKIQMDSLSIKWKNDENGCLNFRNKEIADQLIDKYNIIDGDTINLLSVFGEPTFREFNYSDLLFSYVFGASCFNNQIIEDTDICYVKFTIKRDKVTGIKYVCT